jgi:hypothetical protein
MLRCLCQAPDNRPKERWRPPVQAPRPRWTVAVQPSVRETRICVARLRNPGNKRREHVRDSISREHE